MKSLWQIQPIAIYHGDMKEKFGIPRQARLVEELKGKIVFEAAFREEAALRGLDEFSHIWLIWGFSESQKSESTPFQPTVRPPRLHGNQRMGVFATRSPFRPNSLGMSAVKLEAITNGELHVSGADLLDGTPIFDIKPYLPYADSIPEAKAGYASTDPTTESLVVTWAENVGGGFGQDELTTIEKLLAQDPRPRYQNEPERIYGMRYGAWNVRFQVEDDILTVIEVQRV